MTDITKPPFKNILITGAGGALGSVLRDSLRPYAQTLSLNARQSLGEVRENEKHFICDLAAKPVAHHAGWNFADAKARNAYTPGVFLY